MSLVGHLLLRLDAAELVPVAAVTDERLGTPVDETRSSLSPLLALSLDVTAIIFRYRYRQQFNPFCPNFQNEDSD